MREAAQVLVNLDELNEAAGAAVARGCSAPRPRFVTAGSTAGGSCSRLPRASPATIPAHIARLPDVTGLRHEIHHPARPSLQL